MDDRNDFDNFLFYTIDNTVVADPQAAIPFESLAQGLAKKLRLNEQLVFYY